MSDFGWFQVKMIGLFVLIGFVCWLMHSPWPLLALFFMPSYNSGGAEKSFHE